MDTYYIINSYLENQFVSQSDIFYDKTKALELKTTLDNKSQTQNIIFECKSINNPDKSIMKLYNYKYGFLLVPSKNNIYYGMKKFNKGYWCGDLNGWYYDKDEYDNLINRGYNIIDTKKIDYKLYNFNNFEIFFYKSGFILSPNKTYKYYEQPFLMGHEWNSEHKGWVFKTSKKYRFFIDMGANDYSNDRFFE